MCAGGGQVLAEGRIQEGKDAVGESEDREGRRSDAGAVRQTPLEGHLMRADTGIPVGKARTVTRFVTNCLRPLQKAPASATLPTPENTRTCA